MTLVLAYQNRGTTVSLVANDSAGDPIIPGANDILRAIIGREGDTPKLTVTSEAPTANGSSFTPNYASGGVNRLRLDASDLEFEPGTYSLIVDLFDRADASEWVTIEREVFQLEDT